LETLETGFRALSSGFVQFYRIKKKPRKMRSIQTILISAALLHSASSSPNCDTAIEGGLCPDAFSLDELGACLSSKKAELDDNCALFVEVEMTHSRNIKYTCSLLF
jgi:hypothetical protein